MSDPKPRVAVVEDNHDLREELMFFLKQQGFQAWGADSAEQFWKWLHINGTDIVLVDIGLPGEDGFTVVKHLKQFGQYGLIIVSARGEASASAHGLDLGADLYLVKPLSFPHLLSSIESLWHRMSQGRTPLAAPAVAQEPEGGWALDATSNSLLSPAGAGIRLSQQEYTLLSILMAAPEVVMAKESLAARMFPFENQASGHRIDVIMSRLRKKAREEQLKLPIRAIFGRGLVFVGKAEN